MMPADSYENGRIPGALNAELPEDDVSRCYRWNKTSIYEAGENKGLL